MIDPSSDTFIARLVEAVKDSRILLLLHFRPEYYRDWMTRSIYRNLPLAALDSAGARELLDDLLGQDPSVQDLAPKLVSRALGNPFFIEELIRSLVEAGNLAGQPGTYRLLKPVKTQTLPRTVQTVLAARIDHLGDAAKQVLQTASVMKRFIPTARMNSPDWWRIIGKRPKIHSKPPAGMAVPLV